MKIFKYAIPLWDEFSLSLPDNATIINFHQQDNIPYIWAIVNENIQRQVIRNFILISTDVDFNFDKKEYIGTVHFKMSITNLVLHLFEVIN